MSFNQKFSKGIFLLAISLAFVGCTKSKPYEFIPNKKTVPKEMFSNVDYGNLKPEEISKLSPKEKKEFKTPRIAVMSYGQATRTATAGMPYFQGRTKLVEYEIDEHSIEVRELERDPHFADNPLNSKTIMVIPIRHVDYDCERDAYGECQNKEIEDVKKDWKDRAYVELDFDNTKILDIDELPVEMTNLLSGCYTEGHQKLVNYELNKDVFNFEIQKSYSIDLKNPECWGEIDGFDDLFDKLNFDVRYVYSIVRTDRLASKNYKPIEYKKTDEDTFGFFNTKINHLDVDNSAIENNDTVYLDRWNPNRKVVNYYLSDEFQKPEYNYILAATQTAVQNINNGLMQAGAGLQLQLQAGHGKKVGDLRNNMIVMVDDPLASKIIGYGPTVSNPLTGEIVNARVVLYLGTIKSIIKDTYEDMREEVLSEKENSELTPLNSVTSAVQNIKLQMRALTSAGVRGRNTLAPIHKFENSTLQKSISRMNIAKQLAEFKKEKKSLSSNHNQISTGNLEKIEQDISKFKKLESSSPYAMSSRFLDKRIDVLSKHNIYPAEFLNAEYAMKASGIDKKISNDPKPWSELSSNEKEEIIRTVLPQIWITTLVHELGHNLGLRHNFAGSEDKANFYSRDDLNKMGVTHDIPYSSMMDYSFRSTNELPTMGKYDIAALKYAYKREVDVVDKTGAIKTIKLEKNLEDTEGDLAKQGLELKPYRYCTDENVYANATCNRFDEGTNLVEIAKHYITTYDDFYRRINKRNSRKNFSLYNEDSYLGYMKSVFYPLRLMFELYERVKNDYGIEDGNSLWKSEDFLKEIYDASTLSGQFFLSVLLTPDVNCAVALAAEPSVPIAIFKIRDLDPYATTCFHPDVKSSVDLMGEQNGLQLVVVGEGGKSFKSRKDPLNKNDYQDQIDVQGIWIDKMLALDFLFSRELGSNIFDSNTENYLTHGTIGPNIENVMAAILLGRGGVEVPFRNAQGFPAKFADDNGETTNLLPVSLEFGLDHRIDVPLLSSLIQHFDLPHSQTTFQRELVKTIGRLVPTRIGSSRAEEFLDTFRVLKDLPNSAKKKDYSSIAIGDKTYFATPNNKIAMVAIKSLPAARILKDISVKDAEKMIELKKNNQKLPDNASPQIQSAFKLSKEILEAYVDGEIKSPELYEELLSSLLVN